MHALTGYKGSAAERSDGSTKACKYRPQRGEMMQTTSGRRSGPSHITDPDEVPELDASLWEPTGIKLLWLLFILVLEPSRGPGPGAQPVPQ